MAWKNPQYLVETDWLAAHLDDPALRVLECTTILHPRPELFVGKDAVLAGLGERATCVLNALSEEQHRGTGGVGYGRPGRIAGSGNVPARSLVDPTTHAYLPADVLRERFAAAGALA